MCTFQCGENCECDTVMVELQYWYVLCNIYLKVTVTSDLISVVIMSYTVCLTYSCQT